jgi:hypothetical protein
LVDGVIDCTGNAAYDSSPGGWFDDSVRDLMTITTAPNADKLAITFEIYSPDILGGAIFDVPINAMATVTDTTDASNTQFIKSCFGRLQLTAYEENVSLSGTWQFQAEAGTGPCEEIEEFSYSEAVFTDLAFCP